jgi:hypothetical protein
MFHFGTTFVVKFYILEFVTNLVTLGSITTLLSKNVNCSSFDSVHEYVNITNCDTQIITMCH